MSTENTPIRSLSLNSLNSPRFSAEVTINAAHTGVKTVLANFCTGAKLFAKIQRTDVNITKATIQGEEKMLLKCLDVLKDLLLSQYDAAIVWGEISKVSEENRLTSVIIDETIPGLKRMGSSGEFQEQHFEEISFGASATTENLKKIVKDTVNMMNNAAGGFGVAKGWIPASKKEHISVKYKEKEFDLEVSGLKSLPALIMAVEEKFNNPVPIKSLYRLRDENPIVITDVKDLREGFLYYALTVNEEIPKKTKDVITKFSPEMEEFFKALKDEEGLEDEDVALVKDVFVKQKLKFKQLMETGDLAITDVELERYGIAQGGLRKAILSLIKSNRK